jgi:hypothetical protein
MARSTIGRKCGVSGNPARLSSRLHLHGWLRVASSVTDNFGNRDNLSRGAPEHQKVWASPYVVGRRDTQAVTITSVTEVIGYQL